MARPNSLSSTHGTGKFPPHTDYATEVIPPHYIALVCPVYRSAKTLIYDSEPLRDLEDFRKAVFRVTTGRQSFSTRVITKHNDSFLVRYNADIMEPLNDYASRITSEISPSLKPNFIIDWSDFSYVIIDNWRFLHGREATTDIDAGWLWRLAVGE